MSHASSILRAAASTAALLLLLLAIPAMATDEPAPPAPWEAMGDAWNTLSPERRQAIEGRYLAEREGWAARQHPANASGGTRSLLAATWNQIGPESATVYDLQFDPSNGSRVFGVTEGGFVLSTDGGANWAPLAVETTRVDWYGSARIEVARSDPNTIYAIHYVYFYKSTDGGATWAEQELQIPPSAFYPERLAVDPADPNTVYIAASRWSDLTYDYELQVARSTDGGTSWDLVAPLGVSSSSGFDALEIDPSGHVFAATYDHASGPRRVHIHRSTDGGSSWTEVYATPDDTWGTVSELEIDAGGNLFAAGQFNDQTEPMVHLIRSLDGGDTWQELDVACCASALAVGSLYYTDGLQVYRSDDDGDSWTQLTSLFDGTDWWSYPVSLEVDPTNGQHLIAGVPNRGFIVSTDGGATWAPSHTGLSGVTPEDVLVDPSDPNTIWMAAGALWKTTDGGASWAIVEDVFSASYLAADPTDPNTLYAKDCCGGTLNRSTDGGASWQQIDLWRSVDNASFRGMTVDPDGVLFITGRRWDVSRAFFMASHDHGDSWDSWLLSTTAEPVNLVAPGNGRVYAALWDWEVPGAVVHSTTTQGTDEFRGRIDPEATSGIWYDWAIHVSPSGLIYVGGNTWLDGVYRSLWVSGDGTGTFAPLRQTQDWDQVKAIATDASESAIFIAGDLSGSRPAVLSSTDAGATWQIEVADALGSALAAVDAGGDLTVLAGIVGGGLLASVQPSFGAPVSSGLPPDPPLTDITVSLLGPARYDGVPASFPIPVSLTATHLVGVRAIQIVLDVGTQGHFDLDGVTYAPPSGFSLLSIDPGFDRVTVTATKLGTGIDGEADLGTIHVPTAGSFTQGTEAVLRVRSVALGADFDHLEHLLESNIGIQITLNTQRILAYAAPVGPTLDGVLNGAEWAGARALFVEFSTPDVPPGLANIVAGPPADGSDLSYLVYTLYTPTDLFIGVKVTDDLVQALETEAWQNDDVEIFIDGDLVSNDITSDWSLWNREGFQVGVDASGRKFGFGPAPGLEWDARTQTTATGWSAEFQIPLANIDVTDGAAGQSPPGPGSTLGFNIVVYDDDSATGFYVPGEDTYGKWVGFGASNNESDWGELILNDTPPPPPMLRLLVENPFSNCGGPLPVAGLPNPPVDCGLLEAGFADGATDGLDPQLGEVEQPPRPPNGVFDARFSSAGLYGLLRDLRANPEGPEVTWTIRLQPRVGPLTVSWDPADLSLFTGSWTLRDALLHGELFSVKLSPSQNSTAIPGVDSLELVYSTPAPDDCNYNLPAGWSMISLCGEPTSGDATLATNFPDAISLFRFAGGYQTATELVVGEGYWINNATAGHYVIPVVAVTQLTLDLPGGWSMVGGPIVDVDVSALKSAYANVISVFGFAGGYFTALTIERSEGYWINMANPGQMLLPPPAAKSAPALATDRSVSAGMLWVQSLGHRQEIQLGVEPEAVVELPPRPFAGVLDARVIVGDGNGSWQVPTSDEPTDYAFTVQGPDLELGWDVPSVQGDQWELVMGGVSLSLSGSGTLDLGTHADPAQLILRRVQALPSQFNLSQNYPNPFNPATAIRYDLKETGSVSLAVYDITGQLVKQLVAGEQPAGRYAASWDGNNAAGAPVASGVYLYELRAGSFRSVHKMLLMK